MENDFLNTQINFKNDDNELYIGEVRPGKIILSPLKDIDLQRFGYRVLMEGRGRTSVLKKMRTEKVLLENQTLRAGEIYEFDIELKGVLPGSYKGKNIQFDWRVETFIELGEGSYGEIRNALIKGFKLFKAFDPNRVLAEEKDIFIFQEPQPYSVVPAKANLKNSGCVHWFILILGTVLSLLLLNKSPSPDNTIFASIFIGVLFIFTVGSWLYKRSVIGNLISEVGNLEENQFIVLINLSKGWKGISELQCNYQVIEKVIDDRGTSSSTHRSNIYTSAIKKELGSNQNTKFIFDFPDKNLPASFQVGNVSFIWEVQIKAKLSFGLKSTFTQQIEVKKEKKVLGD